MNSCALADHLHLLQIGNIKPETEIIWSKDSIEIAEDDEDAAKIEKKDCELTFNIGKVSLLEGELWEELGVYELRAKIDPVIYLSFYCGALQNVLQVIHL